MIKLLLAGPREFIDQIQRQAKDNPDIRIIGLATEPSLAVEALEDHARGADAILLGWPDAEIKLMVDIATRHSVQSTIFVSVDNPGAAYRKWTKYKLKLARENTELETISRYFNERPELLCSTGPDRNIFDPLDDDEEEDNPDSIARIEEVRRREKANRAVTVKDKVITVFGQKGGIGKTAISVSMAKSLAFLTDLKVVVLDLDMNRSYGDVIRYFGNVGPKKNEVLCQIDDGSYNGPMPQEKTLAAWAGFPWELRGDRRVAENYLIKDRKNLYYLPPMRLLTEESAISYELVQKTINVLQRHFSVIIIDGGNTLSNPTLSAVEIADELLIVSSPELGVLDNLADFTTDTINMINGDPVISIVINKMPPKTPYKIADELPKITGGFPLIAKFPYDQQLYEKIADSVSVPHLGEETIPFLEEMEKLLRHIYPRELFNDHGGSVNKKTGFFQRILNLAKAK